MRWTNHRRLRHRSQDPLQPNGEGSSGVPARWAPSELNALNEESLRDKVLAAWQPSLDDHGAPRVPLSPPS